MATLQALKNVTELSNLLIRMAAGKGISIAVITQHAGEDGQQATAVHGNVAYDKTCESSKMNAAVVTEVLELLERTMELDNFKEAVAMRYAKMEGSASRKQQSFEELLDMIFKA